MTFSRLLLTLSAAVLAALGVASSFLPAELLTRLGMAPSAYGVLLVQWFGAACLGFTLLDWMSRHTTLGGIYGRPLVVSNLLHFASAALAFLKLAQHAPELRALWPLGLTYSLLSVGFAVALFRAPSRAESAGTTPQR